MKIRQVIDKLLEAYEDFGDKEVYIYSDPEGNRIWTYEGELDPLLTDDGLGIALYPAYDASETVHI